MKRIRCSDCRKAEVINYLMRQAEGMWECHDEGNFVEYEQDYIVAFNAGLKVACIAGLVPDRYDEIRRYFHEYDSDKSTYLARLRGMLEA